MKALHGIKRHPIQWVLFSGMSYLLLGGFVGLFFHKGPLIHQADQFSDIPIWMNLILIGATFSIGAHFAYKETKARH